MDERQQAVAPVGEPVPVTPVDVLVTLADYLHRRTRGMIGSLLWLLRDASCQAILDGTEKITRKSPDRVPPAGSVVTNVPGPLHESHRPISVGHQR